MFSPLSCWYESLLRQERWETLFHLALYDERVYLVLLNEPCVVRAHVERLITSSTEASPAMLRFLSRGLVYKALRDAVLPHFNLLGRNILGMSPSRSTAQEEAIDIHRLAALSDLISQCAVPLDYHEFLAGAQHIPLLESLAAPDDVQPLVSTYTQRAVMRLTPYLCAGPRRSGAESPDVATQLQHGSQLGSLANKIFMESQDYVSRRFALRTAATLSGLVHYDDGKSGMSSALIRTEVTSRVVTEVSSEFTVYAATAFLYSLVRFAIAGRGAGGALCTGGRPLKRCCLTAGLCGGLGVWSHSLLDIRTSRKRARASYCWHTHTSASRDPAEAERLLMHRIFRMQAATYVGTLTLLTATTLRLVAVRFPRWMGDVCFNFPLVPQLFPAVVGLPTRGPQSLIPFTIVPFFAVCGWRYDRSQCSVYDSLVLQARCRRQK